jgi:uncharacterized membrane protein
MKKYTATDLLLLFIMLLPAIYLAIIYKSLPQTIPTHFGLNGADAWGDKSQSWLGVIIISAVSVFLYFLIKNIGSIDPKKKAAVSQKLMNRILFISISFLSLLQIIIINATKGNEFVIQNFLLPVIGIFFCLLGNVMANVKPNYFVGIRTPWTLENEENWRLTHRLGGKLWFWGGLISAILTFLLPHTIGFIIFISIIVIITIIPVGYSFILYKKQKK